jgi:hypothetical protein
MLLTRIETWNQWSQGLKRLNIFNFEPHWLGSPDCFASVLIFKQWKVHWRFFYGRSAHRKASESTDIFIPELSFNIRARSSSNPIFCTYSQTSACNVEKGLFHACSKICIYQEEPVCMNHFTSAHEHETVNTDILTSKVDLYSNSKLPHAGKQSNNLRA